MSPGVPTRAARVGWQSIRRLTARELERLLKDYGFELISQKGSHRKWRHLSKRLQVIVPEHRGRTLPLGTLRAILKGAEIPDSGWIQ